MRAIVLVAGMIATLGAATQLAAQQATAAEGKTLYEANCKMCHGARGIPPQAMVKMMKVPVLDSAYFAKHTDDSVVVVLKKGRGKSMKSFADRLTPDQMLAVARYLRSLSASSS
jgi:mono/diheme cytochrome c family protein